MNDVSILVVDDDDDVRTALLDELSPRYEVTGAACGEEAFALLSAHRFDVVISDLRMPDHDGIEVLDFAQAQQDGIVRILLTGYADDRAHAALLKPGAPYKVGKPWYDEIEVVLARALEQRQRTRLLTASFETAFSIGQVEAAFAATRTLEELGEVLVLRATAITGLVACAAELDGELVAGERPVGGAEWHARLPVDERGRLNLLAGGSDPEARELLGFLVQLAQRHVGLHTAARPTGLDVTRPRRSRVDELMRQATLGAMTGALIHDLAGILQGVEGAILQLRDLAEARGDAELSEVADELGAAGNDALELFISMRKFEREGQAATRSVPAGELVARALRQVGGLARERATLRVAPAPAIAVKAAEPLAVHVLAAILRNAAAASPPDKRGAIDVEVQRDGNVVAFVITDDGPGLPADQVAQVFEPMTWQRPTGAGAGLAIAAYALQVQGGSIAYRRAPGRGACFVVTLPGDGEGEAT